MIEEQLSALKDLWRARPARERRLLAAGALALLLLVGYAALWSPWRNSLARLRAEVPEAREQLAWMRAALPRLQALRAAQQNPGAQPPLAAGSPQATVEQWLATHALRAERTRLEPQGANAVHVVFEKIVFDDLVAALADLDRQTGLVPESIEIARTAHTGRVDARLVLRQP